MFFEKLQNRVNEVNSLLCIGLDPHPKHLENNSAEGALQFCLNIINQTHPFAAAYKPNSAFFEAYGPEGMRALQQISTVLVELNIPIILDLKRGDIDSTAQQYARASYDLYYADAVTLSPYMGWDSIEPFVSGNYQNKGAFILCKTSNPSSNDIQDLKLFTGEKIYEKVSSLVENWSTSKSCNLGLVTGATDIPALKRIRQLAPSGWFLCPGVGAQGGTIESVCKAALRQDGSGLLISVSRGISDPKAAIDGKGMGDVAQRYRDEINSWRTITVNEEQQQQQQQQQNQTQQLLQHQVDFIELAIKNKVLQFGSYKLKSGRISPYFFNAGFFCSGESITLMCRYYAQAIRASGLEFDVIFGPAYKGIPLASGVATAWYELYNEDKSFAYNRKEAKDHGEGGSIVGTDISGKRILIVDDVITAGTAIRESMNILQNASANVVGVVVALDRQETTSVPDENDNGEKLSAIQQVQLQYNIQIVTVICLSDLIQYMKERKFVSFNQEQIEQIRQYQQEYGVYKN
mmetsp:Transcript_17037/g.17787  ORF Transcript_17037/g.17787 Transcript_17037/m.17787 type:complete len:519 (+) Transcript_17037:20-1576(+)